MRPFAAFFLWFLMIYGNGNAFASTQKEDIDGEIKQLKLAKNYEKLYELGTQYRKQAKEIKTERKDQVLLLSLKCFAACTEVKPRSPLALYKCGKNFKDLKKYEGAVHYFKRASLEGYSKSTKKLELLEKEKPQFVTNPIKAPSLKEEIYKRARVIGPLLLSLYGRELLFDALAYGSTLLFNTPESFLISFFIENRSLIIPYWSYLEFYAVFGATHLFSTLVLDGWSD